MDPHLSRSRNPGATETSDQSAATGTAIENGADEVGRSVVGSAPRAVLTLRPLAWRETPLTALTEEIEAFVARARASSDGSPLDRAHTLNRLVCEAVRFDEGATTVTTSAAEALAHGHGVCQDLAHVLCAAARADGLPARYVSGYQFAAGRARDEHASHAWAEIFIDGLGWVSFDPTSGACTTDAYVRLAVGLDYLSASPVRGAVYGGSGEMLNVDVSMEQALWGTGSFGMQSQSIQ